MDSEGDEDLFVEENESGLSPKSQEIVFKHVYNFIRNEYSLDVKADDVKNVCVAAVELFDSIKIQNSTIGGIVRFSIIYLYLFFKYSYS